MAWGNEGGVWHEGKIMSLLSPLFRMSKRVEALWYGPVRQHWSRVYCKSCWAENSCNLAKSYFRSLPYAFQSSLTLCGCEFKASNWSPAFGVLYRVDSEVGNSNTKDNTPTDGKSVQFKKKSCPRVSTNCIYLVWICSNFVLEKLNNILQLPSFKSILCQGRITNAASGIRSESSEGRFGAWWIVREA